MTKQQEKLMKYLFEEAFKIVDKLNYRQVAYILNVVGWNFEVSVAELTADLKAREDLNAESIEQESFWEMFEREGIVIEVEVPDKVKQSRIMEIFERVWYDCGRLKLGYLDQHNLMDDLREIGQALVEVEKLNISDTSKEESSIEYYNLFKDEKRKHRELKELLKQYLELKPAMDKPVLVLEETMKFYELEQKLIEMSDER